MVGASQCLLCLRYGYTCHLHDTAEGLRAEAALQCVFPAAPLTGEFMRFAQCISNSLRSHRIQWQVKNGQYLHESGTYP